MQRTYYNPDVTPDPGEWLALPESERIRLAQSFHVAAKVKVPSMKAHAAIHAAVENQVASGYGPSKRAVARLQSEGLSRHEAIHAIGSVIAQFIYELGQWQTEEQRVSFQSRMGEAIEGLHSKDWLEGENGVCVQPSHLEDRVGAKDARVHLNFWWTRGHYLSAFYCRSSAPTPAQ
jgi:hypothetical protein